ncbi:vWA domain-containing protein [Devosia sp. Root635]|uniref:vWA domain-containing protein n=1 Tax=Devosia sp. Root635 TaxID=1736575 RepID=UPI0006F3E595|nr:VWA domain-containing protein [Devosia sp. Root635]KRA53095.1 hypothetical protein ASD80_13980 [Devosia sp. Root635]
MRWIVLALVFVLGMGITPGLAQSPRTIIVMDGSGSMWGQIDGRPKLEIARETVGEVLAQIPAEQEIGLIAYGHREKGNCGDIELMVPPAAGTGAAISQAVNAMRFLGKTPLSDAVRQAAGALHYTEDAATVVLVTDGLETCSADPCALATELEQAGLNFTAHVIGLGLSQTESAQVSCLASGTGGRYFDAADADGLADALRESVTAPPMAATPPTQPLPEASLDAPATALVGRTLVVGWTGPAMELDTIEIGLPGDRERWAYVYVIEGEPAELLMPGEPGDYELRYKFRDQVVIATRAIAVTESAVTLTAPDQVLAGSEVAIAWMGPDADYDNIQIAEQGSDSYLSYAYVRDNNPVLMTMPDQPGHYELRYKLADTEVIATRAIEVLPANAVLPQVQVAPAPVPVTLAADMGDMGFNIVWSAVPVPGQDLPPEAWALSEATPDPVNADFLPGEYDVRGDAGDQVFGGRIRVEAGAENHFTIPYSAELSPAGEDAPGSGPDAPVPVEIIGVYEGAFSRWAAFPIGGQDSPTIESPDSAPGIWRTQLDPGTWLIRGRHEGATGATYLGVLEVAAGMANPAVIAQPRFGTTQAGGSRVCDGNLPCFVRNDETGLQLGLPIGWSMQQPVLLATAAGVDSGEVFTTFERADSNETMIALNPRQWDAMLGPCEDIPAGRLCRSEAMAAGDLQAYGILRATLELGQAGPVTQAALPSDLAGRIEGVELPAPDGVNLLDLIAPQLASE